MKVLVIGRRDGNIADALVNRFGSGRVKGHTFHSPNEDSLDVRSELLIGQWLEDYGPYDGIVYAAAVNNLRWISQIDMSHLRQTYEVNVFGFVCVVARHVELYPDHPTRIVAVVSDAARTPMRGSLLYGSSKTALTGVIRNMARELAPKQTVVGVSPTVVDNTPMTRFIDDVVPMFRGWSPEQVAEYENAKAGIPLGRRLTKEEVADTLLFALEGPDGLTGSIIEITGGK